MNDSAYDDGEDQDRQHVCSQRVGEEMVPHRPVGKEGNHIVESVEGPAC